MSDAMGARVAVGATHQPLRQAVLDELRRSIIGGIYRPGDRLLEEDLASALEVSRNPVREALQALAVEGFVELEPRRGARVATVTGKRAEELFEIREPLEGLVAQLAARRRTPRQLEQLEEIVAAGLEAAEAGRVGELPGLNRRFHRLLAEAADNRLLAETLQRMSHLVEWVYSFRVRQRSAGSWHEHGAIIEAVAAQDGSTALALASAHIANARAAYLR
jgi:DNA-binding GntR family transcriptional regulator